MVAWWTVEEKRLSADDKIWIGTLNSTGRREENRLNKKQVMKTPHAQSKSSVAAYPVRNSVRWSSAELITTRVLTDTPPRRSSQCPAFDTYVYWWNLHIFSTSSHCNPITRKAPQFLHGRTAESPCRDKSDRKPSITSITDTKLGGEKRRRGERKTENKETEKGN